MRVRDDLRGAMGATVGPRRPRGASLAGWSGSQRLGGGRAVALGRGGVAGSVGTGPRAAHVPLRVAFGDFSRMDAFSAVSEVVLGSSMVPGARLRCFRNVL